MSEKKAQPEETNETVYVRLLRHLACGLHSPNELDSNGEPATVVDALYAIARSINRLADSVGAVDADVRITAMPADIERRKKEDEELDAQLE